MILAPKQIEQLLIERKKPSGGVPLAWDRAEQDALADTLVAYVKVADALREDVLECGGWCDPNDGCLACYQYESCRKRLALAELEAGE